MFISSDPHPLGEHTQQVVYLEDGDIAVVSKDGLSTHRIEGSTDHKVVTIEEQWGDSELGDYPHFMLKEIHEQPEAIRQCISGRTLLSEGTARLGGLNMSKRTMKAIPHVRLIGCGTALYAAQVGRLAIEHLARVPSFAHVASEFRQNDPVIDPHRQQRRALRHGTRAQCNAGPTRDRQVCAARCKREHRGHAKLLDRRFW